MFTKRELLEMTDYFLFLSTDEENYYEVMSINTKHCWKIEKSSDVYKLWHKHNILDRYHLHGQFYLLFDCVLEIVNHDEWKLNVWKYNRKGKRKQIETYFDLLIQSYVLV